MRGNIHTWLIKYGGTLYNYQEMLCGCNFVSLNKKIIKKRPESRLQCAWSIGCFLQVLRELRPCSVCYMFRVCSSSLLSVLGKYRSNWVVVHVDGVRWCLWTAVTNRPIVHPPRDISVWSSIMAWHWKIKAEEPGDKPVPRLLCPQQISHGLTRAWTLESAVRGRWLTAWAMARPPQMWLTSFVWNHFEVTHSYFTNCLSWRKYRFS
jgi:hypothetical protein